MMKRLLVLLLAFPSLVLAQSTPNWPAGYQPNAAEWSAELASKQDVGGGGGSSPTFSALTVTGDGSLSGTFAGNPAFSGNPTFTGAGAGLTVTNNATVGGNFTVGGTFSFGALNITSSTGLQFNGITGMFVTSGSPNQQGVFIGPRAGSYYASHNLSASFGMTAVGVSSLENLSTPGAETVCVGQFTCRLMISGYGVTATGQSVMSFETAPSYTSGFGNDAMRDTIGNGASSAFGAESQRDGVGNNNTSAGAFALHGNSGSIAVTGTPVAGDILRVAFATTNANVTGLPATVSYIVPAAPTNGIIAAGLAAAISAQLAVGFILPDGNNLNTELGITNFVTAFTGASAGLSVNAVGMHFPGSQTIGFAIIPTIGACTGTCTEVLTVADAFSGANDIAVGVKALYAVNLTAGVRDIAVGNLSLANLGGSSSDVICAGDSCGNGMITGNRSVLMGSSAALFAPTVTDSVIIGSGATSGSAVTSLVQDVVVGANNSNQNCITSGANNVEVGYGACVPSPTASNQASIMDAIYITGANHAAGGASYGNIGLGGQTAPGARLDILGVDTTAALSLRVQNSTPTTAFSVANNGTVLTGLGSALATNATAGFLQIATMAGTPTGTVGAAGSAPIVIDTTNKKICYSTGGTWECSAAFTP